jgi:outer membrane protein OmpA-like peptidoglycan-associated protein
MSTRSNSQVGVQPLSALSRRSLLSMLSASGAALILPRQAEAQATMPSAGAIERKLEAAPEAMPDELLTVPQIKRNPRVRRMAPSIDIQAINFRTGSAEIERGEFWKVDRIAQAIENIINGNGDELFLIEGHTDAVGSRRSNQALSEARADSLAETLQQFYGIPGYALEPVGYGEDYLMVPTPRENWRNRRVTIRRITDFIR